MELSAQRKEQTSSTTHGKRYSVSRDVYVFVYVFVYVWLWRWGPPCPWGGSAASPRQSIPSIADQGLERLDPGRFVHRLVPADAVDPWKAKGNARFVARAVMRTVKGQFDDK